MMRHEHKRTAGVSTLEGGNRPPSAHELVGHALMKKGAAARIHRLGKRYHALSLGFDTCSLLSVLSGDRHRNLANKMSTGNIIQGTAIKPSYHHTPSRKILFIGPGARYQVFFFVFLCSLVSPDARFLRTQPHTADNCELRFGFTKNSPRSDNTYINLCTTQSTFWGTNYGKQRTRIES